LAAIFVILKQIISNYIKKEHTFYNSFAFYSGIAGPSIAFLLFIILRRRHIEENKNVSLVKSRKATKMAHKRLELANNHLQTNNKELFYEEIFKALYGYLSDKLSMQVSDLSKTSFLPNF